MPGRAISSIQAGCAVTDSRRIRAKRSPNHRSTASAGLPERMHAGVKQVSRRPLIELGVVPDFSFCQKGWCVMRSVLFALGVTLIAAAFWLKSDASSADGAASRLMGAGCGYSDIRSNGDSCDKNKDGSWRCGPHTNLEAYAGDGNFVTVQLPCADSGCQNTNDVDSCDES